MEPPYSIAFPEPSGPPQLTTFYSFKGGVGRTQSLHNVGARLAALRRKVLMVDVDLEAPGLSIGALPDRVRTSKDGFAEIASDLLFELDVVLDEDPDFFADVIQTYRSRIDGALHVVDVPIEPRNADLADRLRERMNVTNLPTGSLALLTTGRIDPDYPQKMIDVRIDDAFEHTLTDKQQARLPNFLAAAGLPTLPGTPDTLGLVFTAVLRHLLRGATDPSTGDAFQHVLIDSRSGLADVGGLCLRGLPDTRVVLSGLNRQNLEGTRMVLETLSAEDREDDHLTVVFSPVPEGEVELLETRLSDAKETLDVDDEQIHLLHYHPRIALTEDPFAEPIHEHTRIYDEYEALTDRLLALTQSDARTLVSDALDRFRDAGAEADDENRYERLVSALIPAAFLDDDHVESVVDGLCSQMKRTGPYEPEALVLFDLWTALSPKDIRVLGTTANYYCAVGSENASQREGNEAFAFFQRGFTFYQRIVDRNPKEERTWYNWGTHLADLAGIVQTDDPDRAESLYRKAFDKYGRAVDYKPEKHEAWSNWGTGLADLAQLVQTDDPGRAESLYREAFDKYERAVDHKPDLHEAWGNWGVTLVRWGRLCRSSGDVDQADAALTAAIRKLRKSLDHGGGSEALFWLIVAHAERVQNGDLVTAAELLKSLPDNSPRLIYAFDAEDAAVVREQPELRAILDRYREQIDARTELSEDAGDLGSPDSEELDESVKIDVERAINSLPDREAEITRLYFGIGREHPLTLEEIGKRFDLSRDTVHQIKERALRMLRQRHQREDLNATA